MKISIVLGRGIEGCGVTRATLEHQAWYRRNGHTCDVYAFKLGANYIRQTSQENDFTVIRGDKDDLVPYTAKLNDSDVVAYYSLPAGKRTHKLTYTKPCEDFVNHLIKDVNKPLKLMLQFDHKKMSLQRNYKMLETTQLVDLAFTHSLGSAFAEMARGRVPLAKMGFGFNFDAAPGIRKDDTLLEKKLTYLSRYATFKDPRRMFKLLPFCAKRGILLEMNGIERSIGAAELLEDPQYKLIIDDWTKGDRVKAIPQNNTPDLRKGLKTDQVHVFGPYIRSIALEMMSTSMFGCDFYNLDENAYGDNMESAMMEIIWAGAIPVFDSHFGRFCNLRNTQTKLYDVPFFAVWSHKEHGYYELAEKMDEIYNSPEQVKKYRKNSFEVARNHSHIDFVMEDIMNIISKTKKRTNYE